MKTQSLNNLLKGAEMWKQNGNPGKVIPEPGIEEAEFLVQ